MGIFRRPRDSSPSAPASIVRFWQWWQHFQPTLETALAGGLSEEVTAEVDGRVRSIHSEMKWELGYAPGGGGPTLTLTGDGHPELRGLAERWRRAAPQGTGWVFLPARQPDPGMLEQHLTLDDHEFDLQYVKLGMRADTGRGRVHLSAFHPDFLFVSEDTQRQLARQVLYWALGEDDVVRWVGEVQIAMEAPMDALPPSMLQAVVRQIAEPFARPTWLTGEGRTPRGHPARLGVRFPLHRPDYPLCDQHVAIALPYAHSNPDQLPVDPSATALRRFEKQLTKLGERAVLAVRETGDGVQIFHLYADADTGIIGDLDQLAAGWSEGRARVNASPDPGWRDLAPYRP